MEKNTLNRIKIELESFKALVIANLIGAGLTLAFAISYGINKVIPFITGGPLTTDQIPYIILIVTGFVVSITWITNSAELMGEHDDITTEFDEIIKKDGDDEAILGIIVRSLAFYREKQNKINKLKWGGRITGTFLLATALPNLVVFLTGSNTFGGLMKLGQAFSIVSSLVIGIGAWYVPVVIKRFTQTWDTRLNMVDDASLKLRGILEGTE